MNNQNKEIFVFKLFGIPIFSKTKSSIMVFDKEKYKREIIDSVSKELNNELAKRLR